MNNKNFNTTEKLAISAMVIALYVVIMYFTQSFSFGAYQVRIATSLYALSYIFPFLVLPLGLANFLSNLLGGMGPIDMIGGCIVGCVTAFCIVQIRRWKLPSSLCIIPIILVPGFGVATWLTTFTHIPYLLQSLNLCIGQAFPAICGAILLKTITRYVPTNSTITK